MSTLLFEPVLFDGEEATKINNPLASATVLVFKFPVNSNGDYILRLAPEVAKRLIETGRIKKV